jgi:hypothetical protein
MRRVRAFVASVACHPTFFTLLLALLLLTEDDFPGCH